MITLIVSVLIIGIGCSENLQQNEVADISKINSQPINEKIETGNITWEVIEVKDLGTMLTSEDATSYLEPEEGKFIGITFLVKSSEHVPKIIYDLRVIDSEGRVFTVCLPAYAFFNTEEACAIEEVFPDIERRFTATFDVSNDSSGLVLEVTDLNIPPEEKAYIDLGI
jgi:hypothetical protein